MTTTDRPITAGRESQLPPIRDIAAQIRKGADVDTICAQYGVSRSTLQGRFSMAGYTLSTGEEVPKRGGRHEPLESVSLGAGGVYIGGRDWNRGLPSSEAPARHTARRAKRTGLPWDQITADYEARGGRVDAGVWPKTSGKVTVVGGEGMSRHRVHTFAEADADDFDYDQPLANPAPAKTPRKTTARLTSDQAAKVCTRYEDGASIRDLCTEFNVSHTAIQTALRNGGIQTRARGGANGSRSRA